MSSIANPFVHFIKMPDETEDCFTGNENVKPSSLLPGEGCSEKLPSFSMKSFSDDAMKSKRSYTWQKKVKTVDLYQIKQKKLVFAGRYQKIRSTNSATLLVLVIRCCGMGWRSMSCPRIADLWPPKWTLKTLKFVPPRSSA